MNLGRMHYKLIAFPIFLFIVVFIVWASLMEIGEFVRGFGKIVPSGQVKRVQHLEGGILAEILVKEGQQVREGQILYRIRNEFAISNLAELEIALFSKMATEARLRAELNEAEDIQFPSEIIEKIPHIIDNERRLFDQRRANVQNNIEVLVTQYEQKKLQLQENRVRSRNLSLQHRFSNEQQDILESLVGSGAGSQKELIDAKLKTQTLLTELEDLQNKTVTLEKSITEAEARIAESKTRYAVEAQTSLSTVLVEIAKLKEQISANLDRVSRTEIISPVDGVVRALYYRTVGEIVKSGDTVAEILPTNEMLVVDARVQPQDRTRIWIGQPVNISVGSYNPGTYGNITGIVSEISADTFLDEGTRAPYYAVKVESDIRGFSSREIFPGMTAEINIVTGKRTIMIYLVSPLLRIFGTSLTEP